MNFLILTCILLFCSATDVSAQSYKAGVVLYKIIPGTDGPSPIDLMKLNVDQYQKLMESQKDKVDILVFPEYGLTTVEIIPKSEGHWQAYSNTVQEVGTHVCDTNSNSTLARLACAAQASDVYAIVNLLEKDKNSYYVTSVGLDRNGTICLRCRKRHLFKGLHFSTPPAEDNSCVFTANFKAVNVTFSVMFDTDMVYKIPEKMKNENIIMTSSITNGLPLEFGLSLEAGFAVGNNVNLLVSSLWDAVNNFGGSGIYLKNGSSVVAMNAEGLPNALSGSTILIRDVQSKSPDSKKVDFVAEVFGTIPPLNVAYKQIDALTDNKKVTEKCLNETRFCCNFSADVGQETISPYRWVAISNKTTFLNQTVEVFICALIIPSAKAIPSSEAIPVKFKKVEISSNLRRSQVDQSLPISLKKDFVPASFGYEDGEAGTSITLNEEAELLSFGIVQVMLRKDDEGVAKAKAKAAAEDKYKAIVEAKAKAEAEKAKFRDSPRTDARGFSSNTGVVIVVALLVVVVSAAVAGFLIWNKKQRKNRSAV